MVGTQVVETSRRTPATSVERQDTGQENVPVKQLDPVEVTLEEETQDRDSSLNETTREEGEQDIRRTDNLGLGVLSRAGPRRSACDFFLKRQRNIPARSVGFPVPHTKISQRTAGNFPRRS